MAANTVLEGRIRPAGISLVNPGLGLPSEPSFLNSVFRVLN